MIQVIAITHNNEIHSNISVDDPTLSTYKWYWVDFNQPTDDELKHLDQTFRFHPLAIEDCVHRLQRPKLDYYDDYTFFVTHVINQEEDFSKEEINFFIGENYILSFHFYYSNEVNQVWNRLILREKTEDWDEYYVFYQILDKIVDNYFPIIYDIEDALDKIENNTNGTMDLMLEDLFEIRHHLLNLRHSINPMRDLLYRMLNSHHLEGILKRREYFGDIYDHLLKLSEMIMSNREITADIRDSYISINGHQTNKVMQILTIITSIFAPLTFIAGIYGMNFVHMPELDWRYGYFLTLVVMLVISILMFSWFKRKGWF